MIPIEHLTVPKSQALNRDNPQEAVAEIIKVAAVSTDQRKRNIMDLVQQLRYERVETIKNFGIKLNPNFIKINSHILFAPTLQYNGTTVGVNDGVWRAENDKYLKGARCIKWAILSVCGSQGPRRNMLEDMARQVGKMARGKGLNLSEDYEILDSIERFNGNQPNDMKTLDGIMTRLKKNNVELLFVIVKDKFRFKDVYPTVKKAAELRCGMLTQCIQSKTLQSRFDGSTISNILLKLNAKLNGTNHVISNQSFTSVNITKYMLIGADVTHPSPGQTTIPSVVGVATSYDADGFRYNFEWRLQDPRDEMIRDLENIVKEQVAFYQKNLGYYPEHILYYRDGVSDGQFKDVSEIELKAIQRACSRIDLNYKPKITFIVVQKRHHTRFFPVKPNPKDRKNNNVVPGTVVDSEIVNPKIQQFFLVSHKSIQGVAKPAKYCILHDDAKIPAADLQTFTYNLCHLFTRCNRAVSYPAPTYYAHLMAYRGRVYIHG